MFVVLFVAAIAVVLFLGAILYSWLIRRSIACSPFLRNSVVTLNRFEMANKSTVIGENTNIITARTMYA